MTTLVVTNDFPPRIGGIETFVRQVCTFLGDDVVVLTRTERYATAPFDANLPFPIHRIPGPLLPTRRVAQHAARLLERHGVERVVFGAAAPLGLLARPLRTAGATRVVALTHGHEVWWSRVPGARRALRRIGHEVDVLGVISGYTRARIAAALAPADRAKLMVMPPPVDLATFAPGPEPARRTVLAAARFVPQKGLDLLLDAWPRVLGAAPDSRLRIVGDGPQGDSLRRRAARLRGVEVLPSVAHADMPAFLRTGSVFVSPVRTRLAGLYAEGLGVVACEAAASGLPVVVGRSGGAPETVVDGATGTVVDPADPVQLAGAVLRWLRDPDSARAAGLAGRRHVTALVGADVVAERLRAALLLPG